MATQAKRPVLACTQPPEDPRARLNLIPEPRTAVPVVLRFVEGVARWRNRLIAYAVTLVTDWYPPFRLAP
jgi:hypothetical protein